MRQALYRKYRSRGFDEVVGQRHVTELLASAIKTGAISHAYLFTGPRGTGKTSVARIVAHAINDLPYGDDSTHLDIIEIDAASNRRIDDIRDLREKVHIAPTSARYKVYIIDEVHMLTGESFNALLKTLEEPPQHAVFILATTELHKVPATIVSRTQRFHFRPGSTTDVAAHLRMIADQEKISIDDAALRIIAEHSEGGFRDSVSLLDQVSTLGADPIAAETVEGLLGLAPHQQIVRIVESVADYDSRQAITILQRLFDDGVSPVTVIGQMVPYLAEKAMTTPHLYPLLYELIEVPKSHVPLLKLLALIGKQPSPLPLVEQKPTETNQPSQTKPPSAPPTPKPVAEPPRAILSAPANNPPKSPPTPPKTAPANDSIDWERVLGELATRTPAVHSLVKRATVTITPETITLMFTYKLHLKQMQDDKHLSVLTTTIRDLYGSCPAIVPTLGNKQLDETARAVADIMGGGEEVKL